MRYVHKLFSGRHAGRPAAVLTIALGLAFACSESPTGSDSGILEQALFKGKPDKGDKPPPAPTVAAVLLVVDDDSPPGVYGDGSPYTAGIAQACADGRAVFLEAPAGMPPELPLPAVCDTENESGRVQVHLPGDPLAGDQVPYGDAEPSFTFHKKTGKVMATGWMRPTLNLYWDCGGSNSSFCNFVWTDGKSITQTDQGNVTAGTVTGTCAKLYVDYTGVPIPPSVGAPTCDAVDKDDNIVPGFPLELLVDLTVQ